MHRYLFIASLLVCAVGLATAHVTGPQGAGKLMFQQFPTDPAYYTPPVAQLLENGIIERFGEEEFAAVVLTNELHQHIGIYTVLGAKMGIHAREILRAPTRSIHVVMETTLKQPWACTLDGVQMAIGSTLGQNLIEIAANEQPAVAGTFTWEGRRVRLALKDEYQTQLRDIILKAREAHGDLTPAYFDDIEQHCYTVWAKWDRGRIFEVALSHVEATAPESPPEP
jgi:pyrimidine-specific ribonucleoside hydrolase